MEKVSVVFRSGPRHYPRNVKLWIWEGGVSVGVDLGRRS